MLPLDMIIQAALARIALIASRRLTCVWSLDCMLSLHVLPELRMRKERLVTDRALVTRRFFFDFELLHFDILFFFD